MEEHEIKNWTISFAPSIEEIEAMALEIYPKLPDFFKEKVGQIHISAADEPEQYIIDRLELEGPYDLLGFFESSEEGSNDGANRITLYRRAILNHWCENEGILGAVIANVLIYELAQYFGVTDEEIESIEISF